MRYRSIRVQVSKLHLEIFSLPQAIEKSRQFLLLRTDILQKKNSRWVPLTGSHVKNGQLNGLKALFTWRKVASGSKSDQHQFSPNNISRSSRVKVMRITELITSGRIL